MPEFLTTPFSSGPNVVPADVLVRLGFALILGCAVAWVYRRTRKGGPVSASFPATLIFLSVLIAMVTQVIGDNVARAFSLVGALSIVRFRTVVRDTQDTAYVIFAVVLGMAVGARNPWVAGIGLAVIGGAAFVLASLKPQPAEPDFLLSLRVGIGQDVEQLIGATLKTYLRQREMLSIATAKQGSALEVTYAARLCEPDAASDLVKALHKVEGVQNIQLERRAKDEL